MQNPLLYDVAMRTSPISFLFTLVNIVTILSHLLDGLYNFGCVKTNSYVVHPKVNFYAINHGAFSRHQLIAFLLCEFI
ncbi:uncharacterized protein DS421_20g688230 [Arachis hypogaea]|nr:uncharacterized protein DS421_20g688230 [Arachis hypogaea]